MYPHQLSGGMQQRVMIALALMGRPTLLIADEPTTALDVTTQAEILALLARVQREHHMACIFITHDIAVAAQIADRIAVMYSGRVVEEGPASEVLRSPRHRYTRALLRCVPPAGCFGVRSLPTIAGRVPSVMQLMPGCRFAERCAQASTRCRAELPPMAPIGAAGARVACWHPGGGPVQPPPQEEAVTADPETAPAVLEIEGVSRIYRVRERAGALRRRAVAAVDALSLTVARGEFFGLVGESGSGKSTLGRLVAGLDRPTHGVLRVGDFELSPAGLVGEERAFRRFVQPIFQDPRSALDPRHTVARIIAEPLRELLGLREADVLRERVHALMAEVGLPPALDSAIAAQLSGGQQQRVAIARAIAPAPALIVADEPTSALDVSVQGQVMNVLLALCRTRGISFVFITHNLNLVLAVADRVGVMQGGRLLELATPAEILATPRHAYTRRLLAANPVLSHVHAGPVQAMSSMPMNEAP
jgi:oligopeptide/dipeptide ABC transporter ATP-binding protein